MNPTKPNALDAYKQCAGNGCLNPGTVLLEIRYIKKQGYFCTACAEDLLQSELAMMQSGQKKSREKEEVTYARGLGTLALARKRLT